jgi:thymidylate synthase (FAD)
MGVEIIGFSGNPEGLVAAAARISTTAGGAGAIFRKSAEMDAEKNRKLIGKVLRSGHLSVAEHAVFNLAFEDVSVYAEQLLIAFRLASFTVKSRRYVDFGGMGYHVPDFSGYAQGAQWDARYRGHTEGLFALYNKFVAAGVPKEDARFLLPYSFHSHFYCTVNARELNLLLDFLLNGAGQPELRQIGRDLYRQAAELAPGLVTAGEGRGEALSTDGVWPLLAAKRKERNPAEKIGAVTLLSVPENLEAQIAAAALEALGQDARDFEVTDTELQDALLDFALEEPNQRILEAASVTFKMHGVSLAGLTHILRHRMQSVLPPDYVRQADFAAYTLPESVQKAGLEEAYRGAFAAAGAEFQAFAAAGLGELPYLLLSGLCYPVSSTMNARELLLFLGLRTCERAQWEIRAFSEELLRQLQGAHPRLFSRYGPKCFVKGFCPEGAMSCGKPRLRET